jgi:phosphate acetyltransferase
LPRLKPGTLVVSAGDRDDVMLATALAASNGIELAGLVLTHNSFISPAHRALWLTRLSQRPAGTAHAAETAYETAARISRLPLAVPQDDTVRMDAVIESVAEQLDAQAICEGWSLATSKRMSPPAFRYQLIQKARAANKRIVLPEGDEPRTIRAAVICTEKALHAASCWASAR